MDKLIVVPLNLFALEQDIIIVDENGNTPLTRVNLTDLPEVVVTACVAHDIHNIKLIGNANYAGALATEISTHATINYSDNKINISIMEA